MPEVELRPIDKSNWQTCVRLKVVPGQENFVATNVYSLAQAAYEPILTPMGVYDGETMVGFVMYTNRAADDGRHWIVRVMVGADYQRKGYGRAAMIALIERMRGE